MLYVTVADDGTGIDEPKLERLMRSLNELEDGVNSRIGLRNVHQRLVLTYGEASGLQITSGANEWTEVRFMIPIEGDFHA
jgi:two-component system sensor histidine kinase YesM